MHSYSLAHSSAALVMSTDNWVNIPLSLTSLSSSLPFPLQLWTVGHWTAQAMVWCLFHRPLSLIWPHTRATPAMCLVEVALAAARSMDSGLELLPHVEVCANITHLFTYIHYLACELSWPTQCFTTSCFSIPLHPFAIPSLLFLYNHPVSSCSPSLPLCKLSFSLFILSSSAHGQLWTAPLSAVQPMVKSHGQASATCPLLLMSVMRDTFGGWETTKGCALQVEPGLELNQFVQVGMSVCSRFLSWHT